MLDGYSAQADCALHYSKDTASVLAINCVVAVSFMITTHMYSLSDTHTDTVCVCELNSDPYHSYDRSGQDPHDKSQASTLEDLLGPSQDLASPQGLPVSQLLLLLIKHQVVHEVIMPAVMILVLMWAVAQKLHQDCANPRQQHQTRTAQQHHRHHNQQGVPTHHTTHNARAVRWLATAAVMQYCSIAAWWLLRVLKLQDVTLHQLCSILGNMTAVEAAQHSVLHHSLAVHVSQVLQQYLGRVWVVLPAVHKLWVAASAMPWMKWCISASASMVNLPMRLFFPRLVYFLAALCIATSLTFGVVRLLLQKRSRTVSQQAQLKASSARERDGQAEEVPVNLSSISNLVVASLAVTSAPVTLLLGHKGPLIMLLAILLAASILWLLQQYATVTIQCAAVVAAHELGCASGKSGSAGTGKASSSEQHRFTSNVNAVTDTNTWSTSGITAGQAAACISGSCLWSIMGVTFFFTSGHFCEFTGIQYSSPFIGFDAMEWWVSPVLLVLNTFGLQILAALGLALLPIAIYTARDANGKHISRTPDQAADRMSGKGFLISPEANTNASAEGVPKRDTQPVPSSGARPLHQLACLSIAVHMLVQMCSALTITVAAFVLRYNILVWAIIAPRLVFGLFFVALTDMGMLATALACSWVQ